MQIIFESREPWLEQLRELAVRRVRHATKSIVWLTPRARVRVSDRIELEPTWFASFTDASGGAADGKRLYSEQAAQLNAIFHLGPRDSVRMILQKSRTRRDASLYSIALPARSDSDTASLAYGHTVSLGTAAYAGVTLARGVTPGYLPLRRQNELFLKLSWQLQR